MTVLLSIPVVNDAFWALVALDSIYSMAGDGVLKAVVEARVKVNTKAQSMIPNEKLIMTLDENQNIKERFSELIVFQSP